MQIVQHNHQPALQRGDRVHELVDGGFDRAPATASRRSARWPRPRRTRSSAVATYLHSRTGSLSLSSSVTHATAAS